MLQHFVLDGLRGEWSWIHSERSADLRWTESERWAFLADLDRTSPTPVEIAGQYSREVTFTSLDGTPFVCNQSQSYTQRAIFEVVATIEGGTLTVNEVGYQTEPSPCDHGFRHLSSYIVRLGTVTARFSNGDDEQTLVRAAPASATLPTIEWVSANPSFEGTWAWSADLVGGEHPVHATERYELSRGGDGLYGTVTRAIETKSNDGSIIPCAGSASWSVRESVTLAGQPVEDRYLLRELSVARTVVPAGATCLNNTPIRATDSAFAELVGDSITLEWRGRRRQVLLRAP